jgi:hypothetical protein
MRGVAPRWMRLSVSSPQEAEAARLGRTLAKFGVTPPSLSEDWEKVQSFLTRVSR